MTHAQRVVFGQNPNQHHHAFRYIDALGLDPNKVIDAILADLEPKLPSPFPSPNNAPLIGKVTVDEVRLAYHAYPVSGGLVNVGSIHSA